MDCHNFSLDTGWEIFDKNKKVIRTHWDTSHLNIESRIELALNNKTIINQPMKSYVKGFLNLFPHGYRIYGSTPASQSGKYFLGTSDSAVTMGQTALQSPYYATGLASKKLTFERFIEQDTEIEAIISVEGPYTGSNNATIKEIGFGYYGGGGTVYGLMARDVITPVTIRTNDNVKVTYHLHFPQTPAKILNRNFLADIIQNCTNDVGLPLFTTTTGIASVGKPAYQNGLAHMVGGPADSTSQGIVVEESDQEQTWTSYCLGSLVSNSKLSYAAMSLPSSAHAEPNTAWYTITREITNNSSTTRTLREAALYAWDSSPTATYTKGSYMLARWLLGEVTLNPGETLRVYFQPKITC